MLWVPQKSPLRVAHNTGSIGTVSPGTAVTTGATTTAKGAVAELFSSTPFDAYWVTIIAVGYGLQALASEGCLDILTGTSPERVLIPNLLMGYCGGFTDTPPSGPKRWDFPLYIPAGRRIAAQAAGAQVSRAVQVCMYLYGGDGYPRFKVGNKVTTYGVTVPTGAPITPGNGAEGAWAQVTAATTEPHFALVPSYQVENDTTIQNKFHTVDVGLGAAGSEELIGEGFWYTTEVNEQMSGPYNTMPIFQDIPTGTRLAMRASTQSAPDGQYGCAIHAVS